MYIYIYICNHVYVYYVYIYIYVYVYVVLQSHCMLFRECFYMFYFLQDQFADCREKFAGWNRGTCLNRCSLLDSLISLPLFAASAIPSRVIHLLINLLI